MKKSIIAMGVLMAAAFNTSSYAADGQIEFTGKITASTCDISINEQGPNTTINMGTISSSSFKKAGDSADTRRIQIALSNCGADLNKAAVNFSGALDENDQTLLALKDTDGAKGVAIEFLDSKLKRIELNNNPGDFVEIKDNKATMLYLARYTSTQDKVTPGEANATANYTIVYQ